MAIHGGECHFNREDAKNFAASFTTCLPSEIDRAILILGDSHASDLWVAIANDYSDRQILRLTGAGCTLPRSQGKPCRYLYDFAEQWIRQHRKDIDAIIYTQRSDSLFNTALERETSPEIKTEKLTQLFDQLGRFADIGPTLLMIGPHAEFHPKITNVTNASRNVPMFDARMRAGERMVIRTLDDQLAAALAGSGIDYLSTVDAVCGANPCPYLLPDGRPLIVDYGHYSVPGAQYVVQKLVSAYPELRGVLE